MVLSVRQCWALIAGRNTMRRMPFAPLAAGDCRWAAGRQACQWWLWHLRWAGDCRGEGRQAGRCVWQGPQHTRVWGSGAWWLLQLGTWCVWGRLVQGQRAVLCCAAGRRTGGITRGMQAWTPPGLHALSREGRAVMAQAVLCPLELCFIRRGIETSQ